MSKLKLLPFQVKAINALTAQFKRLWQHPESQRPLLFESPTGSGKTLMVCTFVHDLARQPDWNDDIAYVWITFNDDLAMQSRAKFREYFFPNIDGHLMTVDDFRDGKLKDRDVLFMNWQKIVAKSAETRLLRRPDNPEPRNKK